jgi:hypothetical protein
MHQINISYRELNIVKLIVIKSYFCIFLRSLINVRIKMSGKESIYHIIFTNVSIYVKFVIAALAILVNNIVIIDKESLSLIHRYIIFLIDVY